MTHQLTRRQMAAGAAAVLTLALVGLIAAAAMTASAGDHERENRDPEIIGAEAEIYAGGNTFTDEFRADYRLKFDDSDEPTSTNPAKGDSENDGGRETFNRLVNDGEDVYIGQLTFEPENDDGAVGGVDWHTHPGPFIVAVTEGELTVTWEHDCKPRTYEAGEAFVDLGQTVHKAENFADEETVVQFSVVGVPDGEPITNVVADDEDFVEPC